MHKYVAAYDCRQGSVIQDPVSANKACRNKLCHLHTSFHVEDSGCGVVRNFVVKRNDSLKLFRDVDDKWFDGRSGLDLSWLAGGR